MRLMIVVAALGIVTLACGGGSGPGPADLDDLEVEEEAPYFGAANDITLDLEGDIVVALVAANDSRASCEEGSDSACDRLVEPFEGVVDGARAARTRVEALSPPEEVRGWHNEYLTLLDDLESAINELLAAHLAGDLAGIDRALSEFDLVFEREQELIEQFDERTFE